MRFRLELMWFTALTFHLGEKWLPATLDAEHGVVPDQAQGVERRQLLAP